MPLDACHKLVMIVMTIVMTPIMRGDCALHALKVRGIGLAWGSGAPVAVARRADSHCTCCGSMQAFPRTLVHDDV